MKPLPNVSDYRKVYVGALEKRYLKAPMSVNPGCVAIEMAPRAEMVGSIYLPDEFSQKTRPDTGWVVGRGADVPLEPGVPVVIRYKTGKRVKKFSCKGFSAEEMAFIGWAGGRMVDDCYGDPLVWPYKVKWDECVMATIECETIEPTGENVLLQLHPVEKEGSVLLSQKRYQCDGTVIGLGKDAGQGEYEDLKIGKTALFYDGALTFVGDDRAIIRQDAILAVYD